MELENSCKSRQGQIFVSGDTLRIRIKVGFLSIYYILNDYRNYVKIEKFQGFYRI